MPPRWPKTAQDDPKVAQASKPASKPKQKTKEASVEKQASSIDEQRAVAINSSRASRASPSIAIRKRALPVHLPRQVRKSRCLVEARRSLLKKKRLRCSTCFKMPPRCPQDAPRCSQDAPKMAQDRPKMLPSRPQESPRCPPEPPR